MKKYSLISIGFVIMIFIFSEANALFQFMDENKLPQWARNYVETLQEEKIMTGFGDGTFRPDNNLNRAEAVTLLLRLKGIDPSEIEVQSVFPDVETTAWFAPAVVEATNKGWIKGFPNGKFHPEKTLNRAEWATLFSRAFELDQDAPNVEYKDVPSKAWFARPIFALAENELIRETGNYFHPSDPVKRVDAAWLLGKVFNMPRLMGTSKVNDFTRYTRSNSRRTAIKPRNFKVNKQGFNLEREELNFTAVPDGDQVSIRKTSDWQNIGYIEMKNALEDPAKLHYMSFKFNFDKGNVGPEQSFFVKVVSEELELEKQVSRTGEITFTGLNIDAKAGETLVFQVFVKPNSEDYFYPNSGKGQVRLFEAGGSMISTFSRDSYDGVKGYRFAPVGFENRKLRLIDFRP